MESSKLAVVQFGVGTAFFQQRSVIPLFDDVAVLHQQDRVGIDDGGQPMGDHKAGATVHQRLHSLADLDLRPGIHRGSGFV